MKMLIELTEEDLTKAGCKLPLEQISRHHIKAINHRFISEAHRVTLTNRRGQTRLLKTEYSDMAKSLAKKLEASVAQYM